MNNKIFWIASFPKSGNTLLRSILASLFFSREGRFKFGLLDNIPVFESCLRLGFLEKENFKDYNNLSDIKVLSKYWLDMQSHKGLKMNSDFCFLKTHSALLSVENNFFTNNVNSLGYIYIIRDPRDVAISYSKHLNLCIDETIKIMTKDEMCFRYKNLEALKNRKILPLGIQSSWSVNFRSWESFDIPSLIIKYEDIIKNKESLLIKLSNFFKSNYNLEISNFDEKIKNIKKTTSFDNMKYLEEELGFKEAKKHARFFNVGKSYQWKDKLNKNQIDQIEKAFKEEMVQFGYL